MKKAFNNKNLISIIIPVYNCERYIKKCIKSAIEQTYKNIEVLIVNDGSNDNSRIICEEMAKEDSRIKLFNIENHGVSYARNYGIKRSKGEWVTFLDSDDWLEKNFCEVMLDKGIQYNCEYVCCGYNKVYYNRIEKYNSIEKIYTSNEFILELLNVQNGYGFVHMKLINRSVINNIFFNETMNVAEDALFNLELCRNSNKKFLVINEFLYNYRVNENSVVRKYDLNYCNNYVCSMKIIQKYLKKNYTFDKEIEQNFYNFSAYHLFLILVNFCCNKNNEEKNSLKLIKKTCRLDFFKVIIKKCNYNSLSITRKITLFLIKHKLYFGVLLICQIRQNQLNFTRTKEE